MEIIEAPALVREARAAYESNDHVAFRDAAGRLLELSNQFIAGKVRLKLRPAGLLDLKEDAAAEIQRRILEDLRASSLKKGMNTLFTLYLNQTCRDTLESFLRREGIPVPTRHTARAGTTPMQTNVVPHSRRVSFNAPVGDDNTLTLGDIVSVDDDQLPETIVLNKLERLDVMRTLLPEQVLMVAIYGDVVDRKLKTNQIAAQRGLSVADVKQYYNEACRILTQAKERNQ